MLFYVQMIFAEIFVAEVVLADLERALQNFVAWLVLPTSVHLAAADSEVADRDLEVVVEVRVHDLGMLLVAIYSGMLSLRPNHIQ